MTPACPHPMLGSSDNFSEHLTYAEPATGTPAPLLGKLPDELLRCVLLDLSRTDIVNLSCTSRWYYRVATPVLWRDLQLVDRCRSAHPAINGTATPPDDETAELVIDQHDDEVWLRKLLLLIQKPWIAASVRTVTHRCHLPPPAIFDELVITPLSGHTLSPDPRTTKIVELAVRVMTNVTTLQIIFGHPSVNDALLRSFFDRKRVRIVPVRRLWLENCRISAGCDVIVPQHILQLPPHLSFRGLQSIRIRRLPLRPGLPSNTPTSAFLTNFNHARGPHSLGLQNGLGGLYSATTNSSQIEIQPAAVDGDEREIMRQDIGWQVPRSVSQLFQHANVWDDLMYQRLESEMGLPEEVRKWYIPNHSERSQLTWRGRLLDPMEVTIPENITRLGAHVQRERRPSAQVALDMLNSSSSTLTSLCLDWVFTSPHFVRSDHDPLAPKASDSLWAEFFILRFPHLRSFQLRNAAHPATRLPTGLCLLERSTVPVRWITHEQEQTQYRAPFAALEFMEYHEKLICLGWPMDAFFSDSPPEPDIAARIDSVIRRLGSMLVDLRIDAMYKPIEVQTESENLMTSVVRNRRRRFIQEFAAHMTRLESIKIEGGMPRDERREILRALYQCPLQKIVMIGVHWPLGNTWGYDGEDIKELLVRGQVFNLEAEHKDAIHKLGYEKLEPAVPENFRFEAQYGWPPAPPLIHTIGSLFANTVTELKFCGYRGAPVLYSPTPITYPMLAALRHFKNLESLILSVRLDTLFEGLPHDNEVIQYWVNTRSPSSTALVSKSNAPTQGWETELQTKFSPEALADRITKFIGPFLHPEAKSRPGGGVKVRASICLDHWTAAIFDLDVSIGMKYPSSSSSSNSSNDRKNGKVVDRVFVDKCLGFSGPSEELEPTRRKAKLARRRWF